MFRPLLRGAKQEMGSQLEVFRCIPKNRTAEPQRKIVTLQSGKGFCADAQNGAILDLDR